MIASIKMLENLVKHLNKLTNSPEKYGQRIESGEFIINIGHYHIQTHINGLSLLCTISTSGNVTDVFGLVCTKRELFNLIHAYIKGIELNKN